MERLGHSTLLENFAKITGSSLEPMTLAADLFQCRLISQGVTEEAASPYKAKRERLHAIVMAVMGNGSPGSFRGFVEAVRKDPASEWLAQELICTYVYKGGMWADAHGTMSFQQPPPGYTSIPPQFQSLSLRSTEKPTMKVLSSLPRVDWYTVGLELDLDDGELDTIQKDHRVDDKQARLAMYRLWLARQEYASYQQLVDALRMAKENSVARIVCTKFSLLPSPLTPDGSSRCFFGVQPPSHHAPGFPLGQRMDASGYPSGAFGEPSLPLSSLMHSQSFATFSSRNWPGFQAPPTGFHRFPGMAPGQQAGMMPSGNHVPPPLGNHVPPPSGNHVPPPSGNEHSLPSGNLAPPTGAEGQEPQYDYDSHRREWERVNSIPPRSIPPRSRTPPPPASEPMRAMARTLSRCDSPPPSLSSTEQTAGTGGEDLPDLPPEEQVRGPRFSPDDGTMITTEDGKQKYVRYEPYPKSESKKWKSVELSFATLPIYKKKAKPHDPYSKKGEHQGIAVIINNKKFVCQAPREGTSIDEGNLIHTLRYLRYRVEVYRDCSKAEILEIFDGVQKLDHGDFDSFVCCILSHGREGQIYCSDSLLVSLADIASMLNAQNCVSLALKPKMFFVQACRGHKKEHGVRIGTDGPLPDQPSAPQTEEQPPTSQIEDDGEIVIPKEADFLFSYAAPYGQACFRDLDRGSFYVTELCRALCQHSSHLSLHQMLLQVNKKVGEYTYEYRQAPEVVHRLHHEIYF